MTTEAPIVFVDTETTGLDPDRHEIWEVGLIVPGAIQVVHPDRPDTWETAEFHWFLPVTDLGGADPFALSIGRFHERHPWGSAHAAMKRMVLGETVTDIGTFAAQFAHLTHGKHLAGAVVSFDEERLRRLLRRNGRIESWHYHLVDVEALAVGYLASATDGTEALAPPWNSSDLTAALGLHVDESEKHTALGDARWAKAIYEAVMGK